MLTVRACNVIGDFSLSTTTNKPSKVAASRHPHDRPLSSALRFCHPLGRHQDPAAVEAVTYFSGHDYVTLKQSFFSI